MTQDRLVHAAKAMVLLTTLNADVQAPQRERVSLVVRGSVLLQSTGDALKTDSSWKRKIKGNNLESVPRLLWLLEPKIVFAHAKVRVQSSHVHACHQQKADTWPLVCRQAAGDNMQNRSTVRACFLKDITEEEVG